MKKLLSIILALLLVFGLTACGGTDYNSNVQGNQSSVIQSEEVAADEDIKVEDVIDEDGSYDSLEDVALYLWTYGVLPDNYITKKEAKSLGWEGGSVEKYAPGKAIGGDYFGNYEGLLPKEYDYYECDIDTLGESSRGAKRIIYSEDAELIYYTEDHYKSFELLYGEE